MYIFNQASGLNHLLFNFPLKNAQTRHMTTGEVLIGCKPLQTKMTGNHSQINASLWKLSNHWEKTFV